MTRIPRGRLPLLALTVSLLLAGTVFWGCGESHDPGLTGPDTQSSWTPSPQAEPSFLRVAGLEVASGRTVVVSDDYAIWSRGDIVIDGDLIADNSLQKTAGRRGVDILLKSETRIVVRGNIRPGDGGLGEGKTNTGTRGGNLLLEAPLIEIETTELRAGDGGDGGPGGAGGRGGDMTTRGIIRSTTRRKPPTLFAGNGGNGGPAREASGVGNEALPPGAGGDGGHAAAYVPKPWLLQDDDTPVVDPGGVNPNPVACAAGAVGTNGAWVTGGNGGAGAAGAFGNPVGGNGAPGGAGGGATGGPGATGGTGATCCSPPAAGGAGGAGGVGGSGIGGNGGNGGAGGTGVIVGGNGGNGGGAGSGTGGPGGTGGTGGNGCPPGAGGAGGIGGGAVAGIRGAGGAAGTGGVVNGTPGALGAAGAATLGAGGAPGAAGNACCPPVRGGPVLEDQLEGFEWLR